MACNHKFKSELDLSVLDYEPETIIIGTFNPSWPEKNYAEWFYGRTKENHFWEVLPKVYGENSLINGNPVFWKIFCKRHLIGVTDLIACINDADINNPNHLRILGNYSDGEIIKHFSSFATEHIFKIFKYHNSIKNVYLTCRGNGKFYSNLWNSIKELCKEKGIINVEDLLTPSRYAGYQYGRARNRNLTEAKNTVEFILEKWKSKWHTI